MDSPKNTLQEMTDLHIETHGHGSIAVVMLHGWAMHGGALEPLVAALADRCTLYVVDLPGHGYSRANTLPLEPTACAAAIARITPPALWLGWSLGGLIALTAALKHPQQVRGVAVLCGTPKFCRDADWPYGADPLLVPQLAASLATDYRATLERFMVLETIGSRDPRAALHRLRELVFARGEPKPRALQEGIRMLEATDLRAALDKLSVPTLWIAGRRDRLAPPSAIAWAAQRAGGAYHEIAHAGHAPFFDHADAVAHYLTAWLDTLP